MQINTRGLPHSKKNRMTRNLTKQMIRFCLSRFISKRVLDKIVIHVCFNKNFQTDVIWEDRNHRPREFTMNLHLREDMFLLLSDIAHECVHIKQWANGELMEGVNMKSKWHGEWTKTTWKEDDDKAYWEYPWEIEAYGRERGLVHLFCDHVGIENIE